MRKTMLGTVLAAGIALAAPSVAGAAETTDCPRGTAHAHQTVPHKNHQAHSSIPYCPPHDAPRHKSGASH